MNAHPLLPRIANPTQPFHLGLLLLAVAVLLPCRIVAAGPTPVDLGTASAFAVLGASTVTSTGATTIDGDLGVSPGTAITGFPPGIVSNGTIHAADAVASQAHSDLTTAYTNAAAQPCGTDLTGQDLGGLTLTPGVYCFNTSAQLTGILNLDAQGDPRAVWIFKIGTTLTTASGSIVSLIGKAQSCNVFWQIGSSATLGTTTHFAGNILALTSITLVNGSTVEGRALARNGAVTLDTNAVNLPPCGPPLLIGVPANTNASCDAIPQPAQVLAVNDGCSTQTTVAAMIETEFSGSCANTYTLQRVWTASNLCGDSISATQTIAVADTTPPEILSGPEPVAVACASEVPAPNTNLVVAADNCGSVTITFIGDVGTTNGTGGTIARTYQATDECGNSTNYVQSITVNDPTAPQITGPEGPISVSGADCQGIVPDLRDQAQLSDNCGTNGLVVTQSPPVGTPFTIETNVTLTVTDPFGRTNAILVAITTPCVPGVIAVDKTVSLGAFPGLDLVTGTNGTPVTWWIVVRNTGAVTLNSVTITDPPISFTTNFGLLTAGQSATVGVHRAIAGDLTNTVTATGYDVLGLPHTAMDTAAVKRIPNIVSSDCCLQVYEFKASLKNSNIGIKFDRKCNKYFCYKYVENNNLAGYLVVACSECCGQGLQEGGVLYVYRQGDKSKRLFKVPASLTADAFVAKLNGCRPHPLPVGTTDAEGLLVVMGDGELPSFFNDPLDTGNTFLAATGFGKAVTVSVMLPGDCEPTLCTTLDSLSGSIVEVLEYGPSPCGTPYEVLCTGVAMLDGNNGSEFQGPNAVTTGTWSIRRNADKKIVACDPSTIEANILKKMKGYRLQPTQPALTNQ